MGAGAFFLPNRAALWAALAVAGVIWYCSHRTFFGFFGTVAGRVVILVTALLISAMSIVGDTWTAYLGVWTFWMVVVACLYGAFEYRRRRQWEESIEADAGLVFDAGTLTVGEYLERWLKDVEETVRRSTFERYGYAIRPHILPALGRGKLKELDPAHLRAFYRDRLDSGLSPATVHKLHVVLHKALKAAVADGLIPRNAAAGLKLPRIEREEVESLTEDQARLLLETVADAGDRLEALYVLALNTGMRQGELLALKWEDVDLERGILRVRRTLTQEGGTFVLGEPKTKGSRRTIRLTSGAVEALRSHRKRQLEERVWLGSLWQDNGLVFASETGTIINPPNPP